MGQDPADDKELRTPTDSAPQSPIGHELDSTFTKSTARTSIDLFKFYPTIAEKPIIQETTFSYSPGEPLDHHGTTTQRRLPWWRHWIVEITLSVSSLGAFVSKSTPIVNQQQTCQTLMG